MLRQIVLCMVSLVSGVGLALVVGALRGYHVNPDRSAAFAAAHREMELTGVSASTLDELQKRHRELAQKHAGFDAAEPPEAIAILKSHPLLMGMFSLIFLIMFRPAIRSIVIVFLPAVAIAHVLIGYKASASVFAAAVLAAIWSIDYVRAKRRAP